MPSINPVAKSLYLCDGYLGHPGHKTHLFGLFAAIRPAHYPYRHVNLVVFAQLTSGLGQVPFYIDVRSMADGALVHSTVPRLLQFPHRDKLVQLACTIQGCLFPQPGRYLVELFCNGQWVADTSIELL
jgi:hypothetical protein